MSSYSIHIPNWHPTALNKLINKHWAEAMRLKRADAQIIGTYAHMAKVPKAAGKRIIGLIIQLSKGQRAFDTDSYWKSTLDALVGLKYLKDDSRQWVELKPVQFTRGELKATTIEIEDIV